MILGWTALALAGAGYLPAAVQFPPKPVTTPASQYSAVINRYCVTCHNEKLRTAGLVLEKLDVGNPPDGAATWEKVIRKLRTEAMPPAGMPRPDKATYASFATYLETELDRAAAEHPNPGRPAVHRLNRAEYAGAISDLLAIDPDVLDVQSLLPPDDSGYGFDNIGDVLSVSPLLLERYLSVARKITRLALGDPTIRPDFQTYDVSRFLVQSDRVSDDLPFGSRGGIAIRHFFPLDGEYLIRIGLKTTYDGSMILGLAEAHQLDVRLDGERVEQFTVGGQAPAAGELEVRVPVQSGSHVVGVTFRKKTWAKEDILRPRLANMEYDDEPGVGSVSVGGPYDANGPGQTASRNRIFVCYPSSSSENSSPVSDSEKACAKQILATLARRAYRRPITDAEIPNLLGPYESVRGKRDFETAIRVAVERILVSPEFLFRIEHAPANAPPGSVYRIRDLDLASRLSFFLWSSIPDDELLTLASEGKLKEPAVLEQQVRRMLADSRSQALIQNFAGQWLYLRNVQSISPDLGEYPEFDENLREALQQETDLFLESMLREDRGVLDLLDADYTFLNERLARHYGIPNVYGSHFRRVTLSDETRHGLLGKGSILMVTSYPARTSPTIRGKWLLTNMLGTPPPPPPPNVPSLKDRSDDGKILSVREQLEQHRANPVCASCHARMDPLGFALENFDAVGKWRTTSGASKTPIDASGSLPDGTQFEGPEGLRNVLLSQPDQFVMTVTERLLTYALGRGVEYYDIPAIRSILREAAPNQYRWSDLILGIVRSTPFQMSMTRRSASE
jgi:mono/diheme cytochrome c family protein